MMEIFFILMEIQEQKIVSGCKNPSWTFYIAVMHSTVCGCLFLWKEQMQMKLVLAEKPSVAQSLAKVLLAKILSNQVLHLHREYCKLGFHFSIFSSIAVGFSHSKLLIWVGKHLTTTVNSGEHVWQLFNSSPKHGGGCFEYHAVIADKIEYCYVLREYIFVGWIIHMDALQYY